MGGRVPPAPDSPSSRGSCGSYWLTIGLDRLPGCNNLTAMPEPAPTECIGIRTPPAHRPARGLPPSLVTQQCRLAFRAGQNWMGCATIWGMRGVIPYFIAVSTLTGCIMLPYQYLHFIAPAGGLQLRDLINDRKVRSQVREALSSAILPQVTFTAIATIAGIAAGAGWWLLQGVVQISHASASPVPPALTGGGIGLIASINLTVPVLGMERLAFFMAFSSSKGGREWYQWMLHGRGFRRWRWLAVALIYTATLSAYIAELVLMTALWWWGGHLHVSVPLPPHRFPIFWRLLELTGAVLFAGSILMTVGREIARIPAKPAVRRYRQEHPIGRIPFFYPPPPSSLNTTLGDETGQPPAGPDN
jgi:hypothetical protein